MDNSKFKKLLRSMGGVVMGTLVMANLALGATVFSDVPAGHWAEPFINDLVAKGIVNGANPTYRGNDPVTRSEIAQLVAGAFGYLEGEKAVDLNEVGVSITPFKDVPKTAWYALPVYSLAKGGVLNGYTDQTGALTGYFGPGDNATREQVMKIIVGAAGWAKDMSCAQTFVDVGPSSWSYEFVETAYAREIVDGNMVNGQLMFLPGNLADRYQMAKIMSNALNPGDRGCGEEAFNVADARAMSATEVEVCFTQAYDETTAMDPMSYMIAESADSDLELEVTDVAASDDMCVMLTTEAQDPGKNYDLVVTDVMSDMGASLEINEVGFTGYKGGQASDGDLVCSGGEQPTNVNIPRGATGVEFLVVDCTAQGDSVVVDSFMVTRFGPGDENDIENVYLYVDDMRLTTGRDVDSDTQEVNFSGLNYEIGAGESVTFVVVGDIATTADASSQHGFKVMSADSIESNANSIGGSYPITGELMEISGALVGEVNIKRNGSLDEVTIGEHARIAQFQLDASGSEPLALERIALNIRGTCDGDDVTDLELYVTTAGDEDELLAETNGVGYKDLATFTLEESYVIPEGENKTFYVMATNTCRNGETIRTYLDENSDLHVVGTTFGFGARVDNDYDGTGTQYSEVQVKGSEFTVAYSGKPTAGDIAIGQDDAVCMEMNITNTAGATVTIKDWDVAVNVVNGDATNTAGDGDLLDDDGSANYTRFRLVSLDEKGVITGTLLGVSELPNTTEDSNDKTQTVTLSGEETLKAGESVRAAIVFDVEDNADVAGDKIQCVLQNLATAGKEYVEDENGDELDSTAITPAANITGNQFTLSNAGLTFEVVNNPSSRTYVSGTANAGLLGLRVKAGSSLSVTVKELTVQGYVDGDTTSTFSAGSSTDDSGADLQDIVQSVGLYDGNTLVSEVENVNTDGTVVFNNMNLKLTPNQTKNLVLRGNIDSSAPYGAVSDRVKFAIVDKTDVTAIDGQGQNLSTSSIQVDAANNGLTANSGVIMTIAGGGAGTVEENGSPSKKLMTGNSAEIELARYELTSENEDVSLREITFGVVDASNGATLQYAKLYTGSNCQTAVTALGGGDAGTESADVNGVLKFTDINLTVTEAGDTNLCVKGATKSVKSSGLPDSGDTVGVVLLDVPEVIGGAGGNVTAAYTGTQADVLELDMSATTTTVDLLDPANFAEGDVIIIGEEQMMVRSVGASTLTVVRGVGFSNAVGHAEGDFVYASTLAVNTGTRIETAPGSATDSCLTVVTANPQTVGIVVGDVLVAVQEADGQGAGVEYLLVEQSAAAANIVDAGDCGAADNLDVVRGMFNSTVQDWTDAAANSAVYFAEYSERGPVNPLRASKPFFRLPTAAEGGAVSGGTGTSEQAVLRFVIEAQGETGVDFNDADGTNNYDIGDDLIQVRLTGTVAGTNIGVCSLRNVTPGNNETLDTVDVNATPIDATGVDLYFDFFTNNLQITQGGSAILEVRCTMAFASGESMAARIDEVVDGGGTQLANAANAGSVVIYNDGVDPAVEEDGTLIENLPILGPSFVGPAS